MREGGDSMAWSNPAAWLSGPPGGINSYRVIEAFGRRVGGNFQASYRRSGAVATGHIGPGGAALHFASITDEFVASDLFEREDAREEGMRITEEQGRSSFIGAIGWWHAGP